MSQITPIYRFVPYGSRFKAKRDTLVLDVGMETVPGIIDHHHPDAEAECTASLIIKYPSLVLSHIDSDRISQESEQPDVLHIVTHPRPDFDAIASIFLVLRLLETERVDPAMKKIGNFTKMVDSASIPKGWDLSATPYAVLRALFLKIRKRNDEAHLERVKIGLSFFTFLYDKANEGNDIFQNKSLFERIQRYENAIRKAEEDYFDYLLDLEKSQTLSLDLPRDSGLGKKTVDGLIVKNPRSYLFKDWARRDTTHAPLKQGFSFLLTNFGNARFILGVDPEMSIYLKGLGDMLNRKEADQRMLEGRPFTERWYEGNCPLFNFRIIDSPQDISSLSHKQVVDTVLEFSRS